MPKIPDNMTSLWLFPDSLPKEGIVVEFSKFEPAHVTPSGKKVPTFVVMGTVTLKDKDGNPMQPYVGDLTFSSWNVGNLKELKEALGDNTDNWTAGQKFRVSAKEEKLVVEPLPTIEEV